MENVKIVDVNKTTYFVINGEEAEIVQEIIGTDTIHLATAHLLKMAHQIIETLEGED